jgi:ElaB/YqjD/DUF883 family membrane-anchored ribosome-binding protein
MPKMKVAPSRQKESRQSKMAEKNPFDMYEDELDRISNEIEELSSSSSEQETKLPPLKETGRKRGREMPQISETKSRSSNMSIYNTVGKNKRNIVTDTEKYETSSNTMSMATLRRRRDVRVKSLAKKPKNKFQKRAFKDIAKIQRK